MVHAPTKVDVRDEVQRREARGEETRGGVCDVDASRSTIETIVGISDKLTVVVRVHRCAAPIPTRVHRQNCVHPDVGNGIEIASRMQREVEHRFVASIIHHVVANDSAASRAPATASLLTRQVDVDECVVVLRRSAVIVVVRVQVLIDTTGAALLRRPERDGEAGVLGVVDVRDSDPVGIAVKTDTVGTNRRLTVDRHRAVVGGRVSGVSEEGHVNKRVARGRARGQRHREVVLSHGERALNLRRGHGRVGDLQACHVTHEMPVGIQVGAATDDDVLVEVVVLHRSSEVERVRVGNVGRNHRARVVAQR